MVLRVPGTASGLPLIMDGLLMQSASAETTAELPAHLGWGSAAQTAALRRHQQRQRQAKEAAGGRNWLEQLAASRPTAADKTDGVDNTDGADQAKYQAEGAGWVKHYPGLGLGMLRQGRTAPGRLWLLLRYLDQSGSGSLRIDITQRLTKKTSSLYLCGKRQLRNLLKEGEGVYWLRTQERIWLRSVAKVACALGVERLTGRPVALPLHALLDGIGTFRAHLYTAFHSGRSKDTPHGEQAQPIARQTMARLSGVGRSSQRVYEQQAGIHIQANFAVGELATKENGQNRAWVQGPSLFALKDYRGRQGKKGKTYLAWQLPNSYWGGHPQRPKGRQKRINRELQDLVMKGMPGNSEQTAGAQRVGKVYYPNGKLAARAYGRDPGRELYWQQQRTRNGRYVLWQSTGATKSR